MPAPLEDQLGVGGRLVIPVEQTLVVVERSADGRLRRRSAGAVRFVPLVGG